MSLDAPIVPREVSDKLDAVVEDMLAHAPDEFRRYAVAVSIMAHLTMRLADDIPDMPSILRQMAECSARSQERRS